VKATVEKWGRLDTVVNAAGTNDPKRKMVELSQETWDRILATNLTGAFHVTQAALPQMREQKNGLVIHITSISGKWGDNSGAAYQASKHGMVGLAYATMFEERQNGIRVSLIFPGLADTEIIRNRPVPVPQETRDKAMRPEDIAMGCLFIASLPGRTYVPELILMPPALQCVGQGVV
jgi:NAD(P)-dependent dehydrogenase (short-subunit alcohol dehydrogenase family)